MNTQVLTWLYASLTHSLTHSLIGSKTPIVLFGFRTFDRGVGEGNEVRFEAFGPDQVINAYKHNNYKLPRKIVAIGAMDENWGWASNTITNRTASWGYGLVNKNPRRSSGSYSLTHSMILLSSSYLLVRSIRRIFRRRT